MAPPPCRRLGRQCRALDVTLRVAALEGEEDHDATWLFGHTERIDFGRTFEHDDELWCEATLHAPCKHLKTGPDGKQVHCSAHGYKGKVPEPAREPQPRRLGNEWFTIMQHGKPVSRRLEHAPAVRRALPLAPDSNPCATAKCHTSDNQRKAACCRDLQVEVVCSPRQNLLESLLKNRQAPYLCKFEREDERTVLVEMISACTYLKEDGLHCDLHGRKRPDGRPAKPVLCSTWPEKRTGLHPGCAFRNRRLKV
jgi:hypothetical protein